MLYKIKYTSQNTSSLTDLVISLTCSSEVRRNVNNLSGSEVLCHSIPTIYGHIYGQHIIMDKMKYYESLRKFQNE